MLLKTQALIIKKRDLKDADRLVTLYTEELGKIVVKAKSVKKSSAKLKGHLELFILSDVMIAQGKSMDIVTNAEIRENHTRLRNNLEALIVAYYFSELIDKLIVGSEKDKQIWQLLVTSFSQLNHLNPVYANIVSNFENKLLKYLGYDLTQKNTDQSVTDFIQTNLEEKIQSAQYLKQLLRNIKYKK